MVTPVSGCAAGDAQSVLEVCAEPKKDAGLKNSDDTIATSPEATTYRRELDQQKRKAIVSVALGTTYAIPGVFVLGYSLYEKSTPCVPLPGEYAGGSPYPSPCGIDKMATSLGVLLGSIGTLIGVLGFTKGALDLRDANKKLKLFDKGPAVSLNFGVTPDRMPVVAISGNF